MYIYFVEVVGEGVIKVGCTKYPKSRMKSFQCATFHTLHLIGAFPGTYSDEYAVKQRFADDCIRGEWFKASPELWAVARGDAPMPREVDYLPADADPMLRKILLFVERHKMNATTFGSQAADYAGLVTSLRKGKRLSDTMRARVHDFFQTVEKAEVAP